MLTPIRTVSFLFTIMYMSHILGSRPALSAKWDSLSSTQLNIFRRDTNCKPKIDNLSKSKVCSCWHKGLCEDPNNEKKCTCCFKELYEDPSRNCIEKKFCTLNPCRNEAQCQPVLGSYFCICTSNFHGRNCETSGAQGKRVSQPQMYFHSVIVFNEMFTFFFTIDEDFGDNFSFSFTIGRVRIEGSNTVLEEGLLSATILSTRLSVFSENLPPGRKKIFYYISTFPMKKDKDPYVAEIKVEINNNKAVQFSADYDINIIPEINTECCPIIEMDGCGEGTENMIKMQRGKVYSIRSTISRPCNETAQISWYLCNISREVPFPLVKIFKDNAFKDSKKTMSISPVAYKVYPDRWIKCNGPPGRVEENSRPINIEIDIKTSIAISPPVASRSVIENKGNNDVEEIGSRRSEETEIRSPSKDRKTRSPGVSEEETMERNIQYQREKRTIRTRSKELTMGRLSPSVADLRPDGRRIDNYPTRSRAGTSRNEPNCKNQNVQQKEYKIEAYSLVYGVYCFNIMAWVQRCKTTPVNTCWFRIVADTIIAKLEGGSARIVSAGFELVMDASSSTDPNEKIGNNAHLSFEWTCIPEDQSLCSGVSKQTGNKLKLQAVEGNYTFTVKVSVNENKAPTIGTYPEKTLPGPGSASQVVTVLKKVTALSIKCIKNCDRQINSQEVLYLKVMCNTYCDGSEKESYYQWSVRGSEVKESDTELGLNSDKFIMKQNVLNPGTNYTIVVTGGSSGKAELDVIVKRSLMSELGDGNCTISPMEGVSGIDYFNYKCDYSEESLSLPLRFELFQAPDLTKPLTEIMISYSLKPEMKDILLVAGTAEDNYATNIFIRVEDHIGEFAKKLIATVIVKPLTEAPNFKNISDTVEKLINGEQGHPSLEDYINSGDMSGAVNLVSLLTVALESSNLTDKEIWQFKKKFLDAIDQIPIYHDTPLRQITAVLYLIFGAGSTKQQQIPYESIFSSAHILEKISGQLCFEINDSYVEFEVSTEELVNVSKMMLDTTRVLLSVMNTTMSNFTGNISTSTTPLPLRPEDDMIGPDYPSYYELEPEYVCSVKMFKAASTKIVASIQNIGKSMLYRLGEEQAAKHLEVDSVNSWIKIDKPSNLQNQLLGIGNTSQRMKISEELAHAMEKESEYIGIQVTTMKESPFVWDKEENVNTGLLQIDIYNQAINEIPKITSPVDLYMNTTATGSSELVEGNVSVPLKAAHDKDLLDDCISVHKIEANKGQTPYLKFEPFQQPSHKLQIVITEEIRPSIDLFSKYSQTVPLDIKEGKEGEELTVFVDGVSTQEKSWFYIGILPHPDTLESASLLMSNTSNFTIKYGFQVKIIKCLFWNMTSMRWSSDGCRSGPETTPEKLQCRCLHLSTFSGSLLEPSSKEDIFHQISILLLGDENFIIPAFLGSLLAAFFILLIWSNLADRRDKNKRIVTILEGNFPGGSYTYLIGVYTGWKWNAGTTANIGIQLIGENCRGTAHILKDRTRTVHARNSDNWFAIFTAKDLGNLEYLCLWHDNSGHSASWFCERIIVRDIEKNIVWVFVVQQWLSLVHSPSKIFCIVHPFNKGEVHKKASLFENNIKLGLQEQHIWTNIFMRHTQSTYSRTARLTVIFSIIFSTMLISLCFCGIPHGSSTDQIDEASFQFPAREFSLTIAASFVLVPLHFILVAFFRKTAPGIISYNRKAEAILVEPTGERERPKWWLIIINFIMLEPLIHPPRVQKSKSGNDYSNEQKLRQDFKRSQYWFPAWCIFIPWILCILIIIVSVGLLTMYSLMYATLKSQMWIVAIFMYLIFSILILQSLKIIIFSLIITFQLKREPSSLQEADVLFLNIGSEQEEQDKKRVLEIKTLRIQQMYKPLKTQEILKLERRERTRLRLAELFTDICVFLFYIITLYWLILGTRDNLAYFSTDSLEKCIIFTKDLHSMKSGLDINIYMSERFLPAIHKEEWYNEHKIQAAGVTSLYDTRLLGLVRLRQHRVTNKSCVISPVMNQFINGCTVEFSFANEEREDYSIGWEPSEGAAYRETRSSAPWIYHSFWQSGTLPIQGIFSTYPGGGYITTLGRTLENSLLIWNFLVQQNWLDPLTRAFFIEFTLYNANRNIFNIVNLLIEIHSSGAIYVTEDIKTVKLLMKFEDFGFSILIALILWMLILMLFMLRQMSRIGRISFHLYLKSWWNIIDLIILALAIAIIILYFFRSWYVSALVKDLEEADGNEFVNFLWAGYWQIQLRFFTASLVCLSTARLWKLLRFQQQFRNFEHILVKASRTLLFLTFMMIIIIIGFAIFSHIFLGHTIEIFSNFLFAFSAMVTYGIGYSDFDVEDFIKQDTFIGHIFIGIFWIVYIIYLLNIFVTVINIVYEKSNKETGLFQADYTMIDYIREEIEYLCKKRKHNIKPNGPEKYLTIKERYPQYFKENEPDTKGGTWKKESESATKTLAYFVQEQKRIWPSIISHSTRLRAGADTHLKPVYYAPAIAVPKPDEIRNENSQQLKTFRLKAMQFLVLGVIQKQNQNFGYQNAIIAIILDSLEEYKPEDEKDVEAFYSGFDGTEDKFVSNEKLLQMEMTINKIGAERYAAQMKEYENIQHREEFEDEIEDEIMPLDVISHADVLQRQMIRLLNLISDWNPDNESKHQSKIDDLAKTQNQLTEDKAEKEIDKLKENISNTSNISKKYIYKTDFCGLFPYKIENEIDLENTLTHKTANGNTSLPTPQKIKVKKSKSSLAAFSTMQAMHNPFSDTGKPLLAESSNNSRSLDKVNQVTQLTEATAQHRICHVPNPILEEPFLMDRTTDEPIPVPFFVNQRYSNLSTREQLPIVTQENYNSFHATSLHSITTSTGHSNESEMFVPSTIQESTNQLQNNRNSVQASFQRQPYIHFTQGHLTVNNRNMGYSSPDRLNLIDFVRQDQSESLNYENQDSLLPPDYCTHCGFWKLSDDEKLLIIQQGNRTMTQEAYRQQEELPQISHMHHSNYVPREQNTDIEQVQRVLFLLLHSFLYPHQFQDLSQDHSLSSSSALCPRCKLSAGLFGRQQLNQVQHNRRASDVSANRVPVRCQQDTVDMRAHRYSTVSALRGNFNVTGFRGTTQNRGCVNQCIAQNHPRTNPLSHITTDNFNTGVGSFQTERTEKEYVNEGISGVICHSAFPVPRATKRPVCQHGLQRRNPQTSSDEQHMQQFCFTSGVNNSCSNLISSRNQLETHTTEQISPPSCSFHTSDIQHFAPQEQGHQEVSGIMNNPFLQTDFHTPSYQGSHRHNERRLSQKGFRRGKQRRFRRL